MRTLRRAPAIILILLTVSTAFADDLAQLYEKAYFLETAKGQTMDALMIYRKIAAAEVTDENKAVVTKALERMLHIYTVQMRPANNSLQQFEQATRMEEMGFLKDAEVIFKELGTYPEEGIKPNTEQHTFHRKVLIALLEIAAKQADEGKIALYQKRLLQETDETIHSLMLKMPTGGTVYLPEGTWSGNKLAYHSNRNIWVAKEITIKGANRERCIIEGTMDRPFIHANSGSKLTLDTLTIKSEIRTYKKDRTLQDLGCALKVDDNGEITVTNCSFIAKGNSTRSPLGIATDGFSKANILNCRISGFSVPVFFGDGSSGCIAESIIEGELKTRPDTEVCIETTIFHDSKYSAVNCGGGSLAMESCLILNAGRALSAGWNTAAFSMSNSAVINSGNILTHSMSRVSQQGTIMLNNNIFASNHPTLSDGFIQPSRDYGLTKCILRKNIFYKNKLKDWNYVLFAECMKLDPNVFWENEGRRDRDVNPKVIIADPGFKDAENGDFTPRNPDLLKAGHGLTDPGIISRLWQQYKALEP